jgi:hypothetical protein
MRHFDYVRADLIATAHRRRATGPDNCDPCMPEHEGRVLDRIKAAD